MAGVVRAVPRSEGLVRGRPFPTKHGMAASPENKIWRGIKDRCLNSNAPAFPKYGARGITVCERWCGEDGFANFYADMGPRPSPSHSIDREDNDGPYEPGNCRWATDFEQAANRRGVHRIEYGGEILTIAEISRRTGVSYSKLSRGVRAGLPLSDLIPGGRA